MKPVAAILNCLTLPYFILPTTVTYFLRSSRTDYIKQGYNIIGLMTHVRVKIQPYLRVTSLLCEFLDF